MIPFVSLVETQIAYLDDMSLENEHMWVMGRPRTCLSVLRGVSSSCLSASPFFHTKRLVLRNHVHGVSTTTNDQENGNSAELDRLSRPSDTVERSLDTGKGMRRVLTALSHRELSHGEI